MRVCNECREEKAEENFSVSYRRVDGSVGLHKQCKPCRSRMNADRNIYRYHNEPGYKERVAEYQSNLAPEVRQEYRRREYQKNKERYKRSAKSWLENNRAVRRQISRRYKIKRKEWELRGSFSQNEWEELVELTGGVCVRCLKSDVKLTQDHIVPLSKGGINNISNIQPLCGPCNSSKGTKSTNYLKGGDES
jgi:5-methylcytosine-specific restriction endonuclease McrA